MARMTKIQLDRRVYREDYFSNNPKTKRQGPEGPCLIRML
jgi:hypothetical protein